MKYWSEELKNAEEAYRSYFQSKEEPKVSKGKGKKKSTMKSQATEADDRILNFVADMQVDVYKSVSFYNCLYFFLWLVG